MGITYNPSIVTNELTLYLDAGNPRSYPGTGSTWFDLSGNNNHFTLNGSLFHDTAGFYGFSQVNRWYRNSFPSNLKTSQGGNGYTTCVWAICAGATSLYQKLIGNGDSDGYIDLYARQVDGVYHQEDGSSLFYNSGISVENNTFSMGDNVWRMYSSTNLNGGFTTNPTTAFGIGSEGNGAFNYPWNGRIMSVMMYNRVLTTDELTQNFNAFRGRVGV